MQPPPQDNFWNSPNEICVNIPAFLFHVVNMPMIQGIISILCCTLQLLICYLTFVLMPWPAQPEVEQGYHLAAAMDNSIEQCDITGHQIAVYTDPLYYYNSHIWLVLVAGDVQFSDLHSMLCVIHCILRATQGVTLESMICRRTILCVGVHMIDSVCGGYMISLNALSFTHFPWRIQPSFPSHFTANV